MKAKKKKKQKKKRREKEWVKSLRWKQRKTHFMIEVHKRSRLQGKKVHKGQKVTK